MISEYNITQVISELSATRNMYMKELEALPGAELYRSNRRDGIQYSEGSYVDGKLVRRGINKDEGLIHQLARKAFLRQTISAIDADVALLRRIEGKYQSFRPEQIIAELGATYDQLPKEYFLDPAADCVLYELSEEIRARIDRHKAWGAEEYEMFDYKPEERRFISSRGLKVRSRAELLIVEELYKYGVPFRYEQVLKANGRYAPDFTFEDANGEEFYLEYCGMMDKEEYVEHYLNKRRMYERNEINEWDRMIYIYGNGREINMQWLDAVIEHQILQRL